MRRLLIMLCGVFALCVALAGCAGGSANSLEGSWDYDDASLAEYLGDEATPEQKEAAKQLMFLNVNSDGTVQWVMYGDAAEGTWEQGDDGITFTFDEEPYPAELADGKLTIDDGMGGVTFVKAPQARVIPSEEQASEALGVMLGFDIEDIEMTSGDVEEEFDETLYQAVDLTEFESPITIADDDTCTIVATGAGMNGLGDPGYQLQVTNKTDKPIYISTGEFTIAGAEALAYAEETVDANGELGIFMGFDASEMGEDVTVDVLKDVAGSIIVYDDESLEEIATYEVKIA